MDLPPDPHDAADNLSLDDLARLLGRVGLRPTPAQLEGLLAGANRTRVQALALRGLFAVDTEPAAVFRVPAHRPEA